MSMSRQLKLCSLDIEIGEAYSELCQIAKMVLFVKTVNNDFQFLTVLQKALS